MIRRKDFYDVSENNRLDSVQIPFWLLNDQLEREELTRQLALMRGQGIKNTIAHARSGYIGKYLGSDFFDSIDVIVSEKKNIRKSFGCMMNLIGHPERVMEN